MRLPRILISSLPSSASYADPLTVTGKRLLLRLCAGVLAAIAGVIGVLLLGLDDLGPTLAGLLLGAAPGVIVWAFGSFRTTKEDTMLEVRRVAEFDLLDARLNLMAPEMGLRTINLSTEIESILRVREERLGHFAGLDEFRPQLQPNDPGWRFWTPEALGHK